MDETTIALGASKLGGRPDLAPDVAWPMWHGVAMAFIAQIRLEDAAPFDVAHQLPATGLLSFFYDSQQTTNGSKPQDRGGWWVHYEAIERAQVQRQSFPANMPPASQFIAGALTCAADLTLPTSGTPEVVALHWTSEVIARYETLLATFPSAAAHAATHHRLLGHADTLQDDMRLQCQLVAHGVTDMHDPHAATLQAGADQWQLLLQIDSDAASGMQWGDAGMLYYWIEAEALHALRFADTWLVLQSD